MSGYQMWFWTLMIALFLSKWEGWVLAGWWVMGLPLMVLVLAAILEGLLDKWFFKVR